MIMELEKSSQLNPLECGVCQKEFNNPVHLPCLHVFCNGCVDGQSCPECLCPIGEVPPTDLLAKYLVDTAHETAEVCANCDKIAQPMFFCETCQQALCYGCKQNTHQAKMFSSHRLVPLEERARVRGRVSCVMHGEPYILYCVDEKQLVCIQCFNGRPLEARHSFISINNAHASNVEKLEKWTNKLRLFQEEKKEEVEVRTRMLNEVNEKLESEKKEVYHLCEQIIDTVVGVRDRLTSEMEGEKNKVERECREQMNELSAVMTPIRLYLLSAQILCSSASKIDFLQFHSDLMKRIQAVLSRSIGRPPTTQYSETTNAKAEFSKSLEPFLGLSVGWYPSRETREGSGSASYKGRGSAFGSSSIGLPSVLTKYQIMVDLTGAFGEHFCRVEQPLKDMAVELSLLSRRVQEMQRDLTLRRCLIKAERIEELIKSCSTVDGRLGMHSAFISDLQPELQELWQEQLDRVRRQQIIYREKIDNCMQLRETARQVVTAARQLAPFAACIEKMSALIDPRRCHPPDPAPMESICMQISAVEPDSERRIQAIEEEEQNRRLVQEAKRREEVAVREGVVGKLHKAKAKPWKKSSQISRLLVNTNRERSPGGTDTTLTSPCGRPRSTHSLREDHLSDVDSLYEMGDESEEENENELPMSPLDTVDSIMEGSEEPLPTSSNATGLETVSSPPPPLSPLPTLSSPPLPLPPLTLDTTLSIRPDPPHQSSFSDNYVRPNWVTEPISKSQSTPRLRSPSPSTMNTIEHFLLGNQRPIPSERSSVPVMDSRFLDCLLGREKEERESVQKEEEKEESVQREEKKRSRETLTKKKSVECPSLAGRITQDVGESRGNMLKSLQDVFGERGEDDLSVVEQPNVLASAIKIAERKIRDRGDGGEKEKKHQKSKWKPKEKKKRETEDNEESVEKEKEDKTERKPIPPVPIVPDGVLQNSMDRPSNKEFEAREKLLESLREKVPKIDGTPEPE